MPDFSENENSIPQESSIPGNLALQNQRRATGNSIGGALIPTKSTPNLNLKDGASMGNPGF